MQKQREQWTAAPSVFFIAYQHGGKSLPKIAMIFFLKDPDGEPATGPRYMDGQTQKSYAGGGPSFHTRAGRLGGVAYPDTPGDGSKSIVFSKLRPPALYISAKSPDSILIFLPFDSVQG